MTKKILPIAIAALIVGVIGFYGGTKYGVGKDTQTGLIQGGFQNLSPEQRQQRLQQFSGINGMGRAGAGGGFIGGEVLSKDDKSITVKLQDGGSKIVFFSDKTQIIKSVTGAASDLVAGGQVVVSGQINSDGSVTAQSIQIRSEEANQKLD